MHIGKGNLDQAVADCTAAIRLQPENAWAHACRGSAVWPGPFRSGRRRCTAAIELDPRNAWAYVRRGNAHHENGDFDEAIADYTAAIRLEPNDARSYCDRGFTYWSMGDFDHAIVDCSEAIRLEPQMAAAYAYRGAAHRRNGNFEQAIAESAEVIRLEPHNAAAYRRRGVVYETKGDSYRATQDFERRCNLSTRNGRRSQLEIERVGHQPPQARADGEPIGVDAGLAANAQANQPLRIVDRHAGLVARCSSASRRPYADRSWWAVRRPICVESRCGLTFNSDSAISAILAVQRGRGKAFELQVDRSVLRGRCCGRPGR